MMNDQRIKNMECQRKCQKHPTYKAIRPPKSCRECKRIYASRKRGNCYVTCEALYHLLGGKRAGWVPMTLKHEGQTHWYLVKREWDPQQGPWFDSKLGLIKGAWITAVLLDPTVSQFKTPPDYSKGRGCGFLTKKPSKRAKALMEMMVWQSPA